MKYFTVADNRIKPTTNCIKDCCSLSLENAKKIVDSFNIDSNDKAICIDSLYFFYLGILLSYTPNPVNYIQHFADVAVSVSNPDKANDEITLSIYRMMINTFSYGYNQMLTKVLKDRNKYGLFGRAFRTETYTIDDALKDTLILGMFNEKNIINKYRSNELIESILTNFSPIFERYMNN